MRKNTRTLDISKRVFFFRKREEEFRLHVQGSCVGLGGSPDVVYGGKMTWEKPVPRKVVIMLMLIYIG